MALQPRLLVIVLPALVPAMLSAQSIIEEGTRQISSVVGHQVETSILLASQSSLTTGGYRWRINNAEAAITQLPWSIDLTGPSPLDQTGLLWQPVFQGAVGYASFSNSFDSAPLTNSDADFTTYALALGGGPRIYLTTEFSILPSVEAVYGYTENSFDAGSPEAQAFEQATDGQVVNWHAQTLTWVPGLELRYQFPVRNWTFTLTSAYSYFHTRAIERSTDQFSFATDSAAWQNKFDVDYNTGLQVLSQPFHLGGFISRTDLLDGLQDALGTNAIYSVSARATLHTRGRIRGLTDIGIATSYNWGGGFEGYVVGVIIGIGF